MVIHLLLTIKCVSKWLLSGNSAKGKSTRLEDWGRLNELKQVLVSSKQSMTKENPIWHQNQNLDLVLMTLSPSMWPAKVGSSEYLLFWFKSKQVWEIHECILVDKKEIWLAVSQVEKACGSGRWSRCRNLDVDGSNSCYRESKHLVSYLSGQMSFNHLLSF